MLDSRTGDAKVVVVVGGHGGLTGRYLKVTQQLGWTLKHYERRLPRRSIGAIALVVVMIDMVSHTLVAQARALNTATKYVRTASASALRAALEEHEAGNG